MTPHLDVNTRALAAAADPLRLNALRSYRILETPIEPAFQDIVKLATVICQKPIGLISLVDEKRQWFKAEMGLGVRETPIETSVCAHAMLGTNVFEIADLSEDPRFSSNPLVTSPGGIRFYAGAPLISPEGFPLGSLCVIDREPGALSEEQRSMLTALARQAMTHLELRRALASAAIGNKYRSRLMAVAGHDLKQPLQIANMLMETVALTADAANRQRIARSIEALSQVGVGLDRLAQDSQVGDESTQPKIRSFALNMLFDVLKRNWEHHANAKGICLLIPSTELRVETDPNMLTTILGNLVGNAIKFTIHGSVTVLCEDAIDGCRIRVIDTGVGIPSDRLPALFEAFHQEDEQTDGLGLGLSIVQRTVEVLGLQLRIDSTVGEGSTFELFVPDASKNSGDQADQ